MVSENLIPVLVVFTCDSTCDGCINSCIAKKFMCHSQRFKVLVLGSIGNSMGGLGGTGHPVQLDNTQCKDIDYSLHLREMYHTHFK